MTVLLGSLRGYNGYLPATVVTLSTNQETALIAQNLATANVVANTTTGNVQANVLNGVCAVAAAGGSITISNILVDANSQIIASIRQATADVSAFNVARIVPALGSFTIFLNANTTATVLVSWAVSPPAGQSVLN